MEFQVRDSDGDQLKVKRVGHELHIVMHSASGSSAFRLRGKEYLRMLQFLEAMRVHLLHQVECHICGASFECPETPEDGKGWCGPCMAYLMTMEEGD